MAFMASVMEDKSKATLREPRLSSQISVPVSARLSLKVTAHVNRLSNSNAVCPLQEPKAALPTLRLWSFQVKCV